MQNRFRLKGASLEEIRRKAEQQHGPAARIVSAERVISPGIAGLFAGDRYEAIVEVVTGHEVVTGEVVPDPDILADADAPDTVDAVAASHTPDTPDAVPAPAAPAVPAGAVPAHDLKGAAIAALLEEADAAELSLQRPGNPGLSTESPDFAELLEQLGTGLRGPADAPADARTDARAAAAAPVAAAAPSTAPAAAQGLTEDEVIGAVRPFFRDRPKGGGRKKAFMRLQAICRLPDAPDGPFCLAALKQAGLTGMLMGPRRLENNPGLLAHILEHLDG